MLSRLRVENLVLIGEADLELPDGLIAVTGETGAGKTIFTQAIGLLLGAPGDAALVGPAGPEAYVEAELRVPEQLLAEDEFSAIAQHRPADDPAIAIARRVFQDGRSRAYVWGRAVPRADAAALVERVVAMSGQFEQRRLARASHRLSLLDAFAGEAQLQRLRATTVAWRELRAATRAYEEAMASTDDRTSRRTELGALVDATEGLEGGVDASLRAEQERLQHATELVEAAATAAEALSPEGDEPGAGPALARAESALAAVAGIDPDLDAARAELAAAEIAVREVSQELRGFLATERGDPGRLEQVGAELQRIADALRRFDTDSLDDLLVRASAARQELDAEATGDPLERAEASLQAAESAYAELANGLHDARSAAAKPYAKAAKSVLASLGLGNGELVVELAPRDPGPTGTDEAAFLIRTNKGLPLASVAAAASGGELSRIALALRAVAHEHGGEETIVFDEIDAGVGGTTAHAVAGALSDLAQRAQVITITHLPQIASVATTQLRVTKTGGDPEQARIDVLDEDERRQELERMLGGAEFVEALTGTSATPTSG